MPVLPDYSLAGRVAILATTGGDLAPTMAAALAEAGASVFVAARTRELLAGCHQALMRRPGKHGGEFADLTAPEGVAAVLKVFERRYPRVDILVNDTRSFFAKPFAETSLEEWDTTQGRNTRAAFLMCQAVGTRLAAQGYGRVVNLVSVLAERGMINGAAFASSQAGLLSLTRCLALEWGRQNVRVNALGVGWFSGDDTPLEEQQKNLLTRYTPLRRQGHPRDIAPLLVYLCSEACDYATGQPVYMDGGLNARP